MTSSVSIADRDAPALAEGTATLRPLCVDLDGTLSHADVFQESVLTFLLRSPWQLPRFLGWLRHGRAYAKARVADHVAVDGALLPYDERVIAFLRAEKTKGRKIVLATAATAAVANTVARHLGLFDDVLASDERLNLKGDAKARRLGALYGGDYDYLGNSNADLPVWRTAARSLIANGSASVERAARRLGNVEQVFPCQAGMWTSVIRALRPQQWAKNLLAFIPIITADAFGDMHAWWKALQVFVAFCATASTIYVLNDMTDLAADRRHVRKRRRPLASGALTVGAGIGLLCVMALLALATAWMSGAGAVLLLYAVVSVCYSLRLKEFVIVDIFALSFLYSIRLFAGGFVTGYTVSLWLLGFSTFLFLALAVIKRVSELIAAGAAGEAYLARRGYLQKDLPLLQGIGIASSFSAAVLLALYVQSTEVASRYPFPAALWAIVPLVVCWQCRMWLATTRGEMHDDPIVYAAKDWVSWSVSAAVVFVILVAKFKVSMWGG